MQYPSPKARDPHAFEKAREAVKTLHSVRFGLSPSELETLELLLDSDARETISTSVQEAREGKFESLEDAIKE